MNKARLQPNQAVVIRAAEYVKEKHLGHVVCFDCHCAVAGVTKSERNIGDKQVKIRPYFRLPPHAEQNGTGHAENCSFNATKVLDALVADSKNIEDLDSCADALLKRDRDKRVNLRLHILMDAMLASQAFDEAADKEEFWEDVAAGFNFTRSQVVLDAYLRTAKGILKLLAAIQEKPEMQELIRLRYEDQDIPWSEFFFDLEDYGRLQQFLTDRDLVKGTPSEYLRPLAIAVELSGRLPKETRLGNWQVNGVYHKCLPPPLGESQFAIAPWLYFQDENLATSVSKQHCVLAYGLPRISPRSDAPTLYLSPFQIVTMTIGNQHQVCKYRPTLRDLNV